MLTLRQLRVFGYEGEHHIQLATSVGYGASTLLHDDVVDESDLRRGSDTALSGAIWLLSRGVILGQAFRMMVDVGSLAALDVLSNAACVIAEGEVMQSFLRQKTLRQQKMIILPLSKAKTAALFAAYCEMGRCLRSFCVWAAALRSYGMNLGLAFQQMMRWIMVAARVILAKIQAMVSVKVTLPVLLSYRRGTDEERDILA